MSTPGVDGLYVCPAVLSLALGNNPIFKDGKVVGRATGGEFGFRLDKSIALAMVKPDCSNVGDKLQVDILGEMYDATVLDESPYDSENNLLRA